MSELVEAMKQQQEKKANKIDWLGISRLLEAAKIAAEEFYCPRNPDKCSSPNCTCR